MGISFKSKEEESLHFKKLGSCSTPKKVAHLRKIALNKRTHKHEFENNKCIHCKKYRSQFSWYYGAPKI